MLWLSSHLTQGCFVFLEIKLFILEMRRIFWENVSNVLKLSKVTKVREYVF